MMSPPSFALVLAVVSTAFTAAQASPERGVAARAAAVPAVADAAPTATDAGLSVPDAVRLDLPSRETARPALARAHRARARIAYSEPDTSEPAWVDEVLAGLALREKVAQMVMPWIPGGFQDNNAEARRARRLVEVEKVGGLIVGKGDGVGTARWLNDLQRRADVPLLVAADLEWGAGTRLVGATELPVNMAIAAAGDMGYVYEAGQLTAREARAAGIHMAFAPVADVNVNAANPVINTRSYGADPVDVAERVAAFVEGAEEAGLLTAAKHFPGHGDTEADSHLELPIVTASRLRLETVELVPFRAAIAAGVTAIMTAHVAVPALEPNGEVRPATLSREIITDLLRRDMGFDGLIVTDGLMMDGVHEGRPTGEVAVEAVIAGADILLMPPSAREAIDAVVAAVEEGIIDEAWIDASVRRILKAKADVGLPDERQVDLDRSRRVLGAPEHVRWAQDVADRSITLVRSTGQPLPVAVEGRRVVNIVYADGRRSRAGERFIEALDSLGAEVRTVRLWRRSTAAEVRQAERAAREAEVVVFASFARAVPWKGSLAIPERVAELGDRLAARGALVVGFGDPYLLQQLPNAQTYLLAWSDAEVAQRAAARALAGQVRLSGRLPIPLPPHHAMGDGVVAPTLAGEVEPDDPVAEPADAAAADRPTDHLRDSPDPLRDQPDPPRDDADPLRDAPDSGVDSVEAAA